MFFFACWFAMSSKGKTSPSIYLFTNFVLVMVFGYRICIIKSYIIFHVHSKTCRLMGFFLSDEQKETKTCVIDVGAQTTTVAIFQKGVLEKGKTFNTGGTDIKESVSRILGIDLQKAEERKKSETQIERSREIEKIVTLELKKIATNIQKYLKQKELDKEISGGIVLSGGVSCDQSMQDAFKSVFKLPIYKVNIKISDNKTKTDRSWALLQGGVSCITDEIINNTYKNTAKSKIYKWIKSFFKHNGNKITS